MGVNSIRADRLLAIVPRILNKKEAFISGRFIRLCSGRLFLFDGHFMTFSPIDRSIKTAQMFFEDCGAPS